jgi:5-methylcytosine-specific restriction endonuclease McrA
MKSHLHKSSVLVLNRNWQAVGIKTPAEAFCMIVGGNATPLHIQGDDVLEKLTWDEWKNLPVQEGEAHVKTAHGPIRVPTVIVAARYDKVPQHRPKFSSKSIWKRDGGRCQYTGQLLKPDEGNIDHIIPVSKGGSTSWENCVLSHRKVNAKKGNKLPHEAGLKLLRMPFKPRPVPVTLVLQELAHEDKNISPDWKKFLG